MNKNQREELPLQDKTCGYCGKKIEKVNVIYNGFYDKDLDMNICNDCKPQFYDFKKKSIFKNKKSEFPIF